jgi:hypothetical protein
MGKYDNIDIIQQMIEVTKMSRGNEEAAIKNQTDNNNEKMTVILKYCFY